MIASDARKRLCQCTIWAETPRSSSRLAVGLAVGMAAQTARRATPNSNKRRGWPRRMEERERLSRQVHETSDHVHAS